MICPKCGEDNSDNFRFCGLCGTPLEARVEARRPAGAPVPNLPMPHLPLSQPTTASTTEPLRPPIQADPNQAIPIQPRPNLPSVDTLRDTAFSGLDSFFEPEKPKNGAGRILLLVVLLAALGGAGWWTYTNYLGTTEVGKPAAPSSDASDVPSDKPAPKPAIRDAAPAPAPSPDAGPSQAVIPPAAASDSPSDAKSSAPAPVPAPTAKSDETAAQPEPKPENPKIAAREQAPVKREVKATPAKLANTPPPTDTGDAAFRKGEAFLYGRGAPENCDEAVKNLKAASAKSNAKARSAFGTMYATGHCVPRDLPTSYSWFALALHADPNNQILEKDLNAVWNQMTPPERQMATRMKQ